METFRLPSTTDFHIPTALVGRLLSWSKEKGTTFEIIKKNLQVYYASTVDLESLLKIVDDIDQTKEMGDAKSMKVLNHVISYLRIKLLSRDLREIQMTAALLDVLVKNCQYRVHIHVGKRIFMKTFCQTIRLLLADGRENHRCVGVHMLDVLQGWGEAFTTSRKEIYPEIVASYEKMKYKYGYVYPRPDYDATRVPLFLGPINSYELSEARSNSQMGGLFQVGEGTKHRQRAASDLDLETSLNLHIVAKAETKETDHDFSVDNESVASSKEFHSSQVLPLVPVSTDMMTFEETSLTTSSSHKFSNLPSPLPPSPYFREGFVSKDLSHYNSNITKVYKSTRNLSSSPHILSNATSPLRFAKTDNDINIHTTIGEESNMIDSTISTALINDGTPPTPYFSTDIDPYYGGIASGIRSHQSITENRNESKRLSGMINVDIKKLIENMRIKERQNLINDGTPPTPYFSTDIDPYYGGIASGIRSHQSITENKNKSKRLSGMINVDIKKLIENMRIREGQNPTPRVKEICATYDFQTVYTSKNPAEQKGNITKVDIVGSQIQDSSKYEGDSQVVNSKEDSTERVDNISKKDVMADQMRYSSKCVVSEIGLLKDKMKGENSIEANIDDEDTTAYYIGTSENTEDKIVEDNEIKMGKKIINHIVVTPDVKEPPIATTTSFEIDIDDALMLYPSDRIHLAFYFSALDKPTVDPDNFDSECSNSDGKDIIQKPRKKSTNGMCPPSSDPSVEVKYFGHQRIVLKKR